MKFLQGFMAHNTSCCYFYWIVIVARRLVSSPGEREKKQKAYDVLPVRGTAPCAFNTFSCYTSE